MEKSMQPQVQSEQDKMVPIDTSGDPVEVTVNPEKTEEKKETKQPEVQVEQVEEQQAEAPAEETKESELEDYSQNVQKRIDKLTRKMREAERREKAAIEYAKKINDKFKAALAPILGLSIASPSYSAIKNRLVRLDKKTSSNTYRYLNSNINDKQYILYYSYLFGFAGLDGVAKEIEAVVEQNNRNKRISFLLNDKEEQQYKDKPKNYIATIR